jgi:hypothetical protein
MPKASGAADYVFEGVWTNWKKGSVFGFTLTLSPDHAALLLPAITLLISIAGSQLWQLLRFNLHQMRATSSRRDFLYHEVQVALRNTATELEMLWRLIRIGAAWWDQGARVMRQLAFLAFWILLHFILVLLAGLFVPSLLNAGDEVLSRSQWCGWYNQTYLAAIFSPQKPPDEIIRQAMEYQNNINSIYASIQQHVDICETSVDGCNTLPVKSLKFNSNIAPGECPFEQSVCHPDIDGLIHFDTGFLSSSSDLGFNAPKQDRVSFRMTARCAPLHDKKFVSGWIDVPATADAPAYQIADAMYGPGFTSQRNVTYSTTKQHFQCEEGMVVPPYNLNAEFAPPGEDLNISVATFDPIPELRLTNANTYLIMLTFRGFYEGKVSDPWYAARIAFNDTNAFCLEEEKIIYSRDLPITTIGCTQQWEVCNADADGQLKSTSCTPPLALSQIKAFMKTPNATVLFNDRQRATVDRINSASNGASFRFVIDSLSQSTTAPLQARHLVSSIISLPLPSTQWQIETGYWFSILLAYLQQISLQISTGQFAASTEYINVTVPSTTDKLQQAAYNLCQNQVILSDSYRSFKFFALIMIAVTCVIIIILGLCIEDVVKFIRQHRGRDNDHNGRETMWTMNRDIEMLRIISTLKHSLTWNRRKRGDIPVIGIEHKVGIFDLVSDAWDVEEGGETVDAQLITDNQHLLADQQQSTTSGEPCRPGFRRYTITTTAVNPRSSSDQPPPTVPSSTPVRTMAPQSDSNHRTVVSPMNIELNDARDVEEGREIVGAQHITDNQHLPADQQQSTTSGEPCRPGFRRYTVTTTAVKPRSSSDQPPPTVPSPTPVRTMAPQSDSDHRTVVSPLNIELRTLRSFAARMHDLDSR